ncbi:CinA family nicotinamide mononucleotide deamidase-related protein [Photobacterium minamisatsumaniensis]|uniref:CinA family nicotinamide mononucleotide deamidase-related protein n=1 Tax=Photobacterium minamisatsumaniensis TaxID=2910233 RepID=UPI003D09F417
MLQVAMISTGEEVLHGDITDTNAAWLSRLFFEQGFAMTRRTTVGDQLEMLAKEIEHCSLTADVVVVNGGLGPTTDDLTAQAAAIAADVGLELSEYWVAEMEAKYAKLNRVMPETNLKQAMLPEGAELLDNPVGTACGFSMQLNRAWIFFTPGVPSEFKVMAHDQIIPRLVGSFSSDQAKDCHRLYTFGLSESGIGETLQRITLPDGFEFGYRSSLPFIEVKIFCPREHAEADAILEQVRDLLGDNVVGVEQPLVEEVSSLLTKTDYSLTIAEQATGGFLTSWLHDVPDMNAHIQKAWVLGDENTVEHTQSEQLGAVLAIAAAARDNACNGGNTTGGGIIMASGKLHDGQVAVVISTPEGDWAQVITTKRQYASRDFRYVLSTVMLDMLRRWLSGKDVIGQYESLTRIDEAYIVSEKQNEG